MALEALNKEEQRLQWCLSVVQVCFLLPLVEVLCFFEIFSPSYEVLFSSSTILLSPLLQVQLHKGSCTTFPAFSSGIFSLNLHCVSDNHGSQFRVYRRSLIHENARACSAFPLSCTCHHALNILSPAKGVVEMEILLQSPLGPKSIIG